MKPLRGWKIAASGSALAAVTALAYGTSQRKRTTSRALATLEGQGSEGLACATFSLGQTHNVA